MNDVLKISAGMLLQGLKMNGLRRSLQERFLQDLKTNSLFKISAGTFCSGFHLDWFPQNLSRIVFQVA
jgi:hypothetical protein